MFNKLKKHTFQTAYLFIENLSSTILTGECKESQNITGVNFGVSPQGQQT